MNGIAHRLMFENHCRVCALPTSKIKMAAHALPNAPASTPSSPLRRGRPCGTTFPSTVDRERLTGIVAAYRHPPPKAISWRILIFKDRGLKKLTARVDVHLAVNNGG